MTVSLNSLNVGIELTTEREPVYKIKNILSDQVNDKNDLDENESDNDPNGTVNSNNSQNGLYLHQNSSSWLNNEIICILVFVLIYLYQQYQYYQYSVISYQYLFGNIMIQNKTDQNLVHRYQYQILQEIARLYTQNNAMIDTRFFKLINSFR